MVAPDSNRLHSPAFAMSNPSTYYGYERTEVSALLPHHYSTALEIGCGEGAFRRNLTRSVEYWGVEPVPAAARVAQGQLDKVLTGTFQDVQGEIPDRYFDLVICNDVIEHLPDPDEFLRCIQRKIRPDGHLVASIPNVRYIGNLWELLVGRDWEYKDEGILDRTHLRFFTRKSIVRAFRRNGFSIEEIAGINRYRTRSPLKYILYLIAVLLFGQDIKFLQFAVRAKESPTPPTGA